MGIVVVKESITSKNSFLLLRCIYYNIILEDVYERRGKLYIKERFIIFSFRFIIAIVEERTILILYVGYQWRSILKRNRNGLIKRFTL